MIDKFRENDATVAQFRKLFMMVKNTARICDCHILTTCVIDVRKDVFASYPPAASICASAKPTLAAASTYQDTTLTGWSLTVTAGDVLRFVLESSSTFTAIYFSLEFEPT